MTGLLDRMERDGLVARVADPSDRRALSIQLTERGTEAREPVLEVVNRAVGNVMDGVTDAELEGLKATLRRMLANAHEMGDRQ